jgi:hypothetical protein
MSKFITRTDSIQLYARVIGATSNQWVFNYEVKRGYKVFGIKMRKQVHVHTFAFPRYSNNAHRDGLRQEMAAQRQKLTIAKPSLFQ